MWAYAHDPDGVLAAASVSVFVISIFLMFLASTLYHSMNPQSKHKDVFHILDHIFIYVAIAGSYTPIALVGHRRLAGRVHHRPPMGDGHFRRLLQVALPKVDTGRQPDHLPGHGLDDRLLPAAVHAATLRRPSLALIALGGVLYTLGAWFYARKGFRYHHMVWHLLIDLAVAAHFAGIVFYLY